MLGVLAAAATALATCAADAEDATVTQGADGELLLCPPGGINGTVHVGGTLQTAALDGLRSEMQVLRQLSAKAKQEE